MADRRLLVLFLTIVVLATTHDAGHAATITQQQGIGSMMRSMVGSRPPSCAGRCWWCSGRRRCEAVQVPVTPQQEMQLKNKNKIQGAAAAQGSRRLPFPSSYDDRTNYKPLSWRCMCGEVIILSP